MKPLLESGVAPPGLVSRITFTVRRGIQYPLARDRVHYVGEAVAVAVAESRALAEDALERIRVEYEPLPAVVDPEAALAPGASRVHPEWPDNVAVHFSHAIGDVEGAFHRADVVVRERFRIQRYVGMPIETRGIVAESGSRETTVTVWTSHQIPHLLQRALAEVLGIPAHRVRVVTPDVGGGFGTKAAVYQEDMLIPLLAVRLGRPVKWIEDRREHMQAAAHAREQIHDLELAARRDGTLLAVRDRILLDQGAFNPWGIVLPYNTVAHLLGPYKVRNFAVEVAAVATNKAPHAPYRGAGRPEAVFAMERGLERLARAVGVDPAALRRRNLIGPEALPYDTGLLYRDGNPLVYDSGDFPGALEAALAAVDYAGVRAEQGALRARGVYRGVGVAAYVEGTGLGPYEGAVVRLDATGGVWVATGACSQGQGHETSFAQIAADALGVLLESVSVVGGDTGAIAFGIGTFASRGAVVAGNAVAAAAGQVRAQVLAVAAGVLEAKAEDLELEGGQVFVRGVPSTAVPLGRVIQSALPSFAQAGAGVGFTATVYQGVPTVTYASAVHAAVVEVDAETGQVRVLRYGVAHDCGRVIHPLIVEGQVRGGVAQGVGGALLEEMMYDEQGQLLTASFMDYLVPTAMEVPAIRTVHLEFPSPRNPLGVKGLGEGGAIGPPAAVANAVEDALAPFGVKVTRTPLSPNRILALIREAGARPLGSA
ncbi:MAG: molybdopterin-dependent oxidoreductase [Candidatus Rokubacteria bacterium]|nr:molybdopterin-dependent oxidoreductase [Candidatus Rokubacteria bacterium]